MNSSLFTADRNTHIMIVIVAFVVTIAVTFFAIYTRVGSIVTVNAHNGPDRPQSFRPMSF